MTELTPEKLAALRAGLLQTIPIELKPTEIISLLDRIAVLTAMLRSYMCFTHGLCCHGCKAQGRALADRCCKDADCDAGWYGVDADCIRDLLNAGEVLIPGTIAEIENPPEPINECATTADNRKPGGERRQINVGGPIKIVGDSTSTDPNRRTSERRKA